MEERITVLRKEPGKKPEIIEIPNTLEALQGEVGGYIEVLPEGDLLIICDEEGKLKGKEYNFSYREDILVGTVIIAGDDGEEIGSVKSMFKAWQIAEGRIR